jgi:hypothetical protein
MKKLLATVIILSACSVQPNIYAKNTFDLNSLESANTYLSQRQNDYDLLGFIGKEDATIVEFSSKGCLTTYTQIGKGTSYSGHKIDLMQKVIIDWTKVSSLNEFYVNDRSSGFKLFPIGNVFYTQYVKLVRGWDSQQNGKTIVFRFNPDTPEDTVKQTIQAMHFIQNKCRKST